MDFLRKLFPLIKNKNKQDTNNRNNINDTELSLDGYSLEFDVNVINSINLNNNEDYTTTLDSTVVDVSLVPDKILCTLDNVVPIRISSKESKDKELHEYINGDFGVSNETYFVEAAYLANDVKDNTASDNLVHSKNPLGDENNDKISNKTKLYDTAVIDDDTLQNLREFEATLNNFDTTACSSDDSVKDFINLDEFDDILDKLDTINEDLCSENRSVVNSCTQNEENPICNNTNIIENFANPRTSSTVLDNIDIISISSTENEKSQCDDIQEQYTVLIDSDSQEAEYSECEGYHSSDFEFISETEAKMDGFIINFRPKKFENDTLSDTSSDSEPLSAYVSKHMKETGNETGGDCGAGPSKNRSKHEFADRSYRNNHVIPNGDDYLGLFQGIYNPVLPVSEIFFLENKSVRASAMNVQYDGVGFDKQLAHRRPERDSSEDEFEDEAKESAKKILRMYPSDNRKRRRH